MKVEQLHKAQKLQKEIQELTDFLFIICPEMINSPIIYGERSMTVKTESKKSFRLFGKRFFVAGSHLKEISVPKEMIFDIAIIVKSKLDELTSEMDKL